MSDRNDSDSSSERVEIGEHSSLRQQEKTMSLAGSVVKTGGSFRALFKVEKISADVYRGCNLKRFGNARSVYGGQLVAQTLKAAALSTDPAYKPHSLHCYFIRGVRDDVPIEYHVERLRDGGSFVTRAVRAIQNDNLVFHMIGSFSKPESMPAEHQCEMPDVPRPSQLKNIQQLVQEYIARYNVPDEIASYTKRRLKTYSTSTLIDMCPVDPDLYLQHRILKTPGIPPTDPKILVWMKMGNDAIAGDELLPYYVAAFFSDWGPISASWFPHPSLNVDFATSLDHSMWFHESFDPTDWLLFDCSCPKLHSARSLSLGRIWSQDGRLLASFSQEGLTRGQIADSKL